MSKKYPIPQLAEFRPRSDDMHNPFLLSTVHCVHDSVVSRVLQSVQPRQENFWAGKVLPAVDIIMMTEYKWCKKVELQRMF